MSFSVAILFGVQPASAYRHHAASSIASVSSFFAWGLNNEGQLGTGTTTNSDVPTTVNGLGAFTAVATAGYGFSGFTLGLLNNGTVMAWGSNSEGELGDGTTTSSTKPVMVNGLTGVTAIAADADISFALLKNGTVEGWGDNGYGQLGNGAPTRGSVDHPVAVKGLSGVSAVAAGQGHGLALLTNGTVMAWGENANGQLGIGTTTNSPTPVLVPGLSGVTAIAAGGNTSAALLSDGKVMAWGADSGNGTDNATVTSPVPVQGLSRSSVKAISVGDSFALALLSNGEVMGWGSNLWGQLGVGKAGCDCSISSATLLPGRTGVKAISAAVDHGLAILKNGTVVAWGRDDDGELGNGTTVTTGCSCISHRVSVESLQGITAIDAGGYQSFAW